MLARDLLHEVEEVGPGMAIAELMRDLPCGNFERGEEVVELTRFGGQVDYAAVRSSFSYLCSYSLGVK